MGHCEGLGFAQPSQHRNLTMHAVSTKYVNVGLCTAQVVGKSYYRRGFWHFDLHDVVPGVAHVFDHCPPAIYAGVVSLIPVLADRISDNV